MSRSIAGLPLELLINVVSDLGLEDFINLKTASKGLFRLLNNESLSRQLSKVEGSLFLLLPPIANSIPIPQPILSITNPYAIQPQSSKLPATNATQP